MAKDTYMYKQLNSDFKQIASKLRARVEELESDVDSAKETANQESFCEGAKAANPNLTEQEVFRLWLDFNASN